jgi:hypothetical protein
VTINIFIPVKNFAIILDVAIAKWLIFKEINNRINTIHGNKKRLKACII